MVSARLLVIHGRLAGQPIPHAMKSPKVGGCYPPICASSTGYSHD